jgi:flagellar motor switch protein FliG
MKRKLTGWKDIIKHESRCLYLQKIMTSMDTKDIAILLAHNCPKKLKELFYSMMDKKTIRYVALDSGKMIITKEMSLDFQYHFMRLWYIIDTFHIDVKWNE